jgi:hypothetical protein
LSEAVYDLSDRAKRALVELHEEFKQRAETGGKILMPRWFWANLSAEYERRMSEIIRGSFTEVDNERDVRVRCPQCKREGTIRGTQSRWTCCGQDHYTFGTLVEG